MNSSRSFGRLNKRRPRRAGSIGYANSRAGRTRSPTAAQIETVQQLQDARRYAFLDHVLVHRLEGAADFAPSVPAELSSANLVSFSNARALRPYRGELAQDRIA